MDKKLFIEVEGKMEKTVENLKFELSALRTGRASPALLESVKVEYYNSYVPLKQLASIFVPEPRVLEIKPWDKSTISAIEKAILKANLGISPVNDGNNIRLTIPVLTEERRQELLKIAHNITEEHRVTIRAIRRESLELLKKMEKEKQISEDTFYKQEEELNKISEKYMQKINEILEKKEKEIMEV